MHAITGHVSVLVHQMEFAGTRILPARAAIVACAERRQRDGRVRRELRRGMRGRGDMEARTVEPGNRRSEEEGMYGPARPTSLRGRVRAVAEPRGAPTAPIGRFGAVWVLACPTRAANLRGPPRRGRKSYARITRSPVPHSLGLGRLEERELERHGKGTDTKRRHGCAGPKTRNTNPVFPRHGRPIAPSAHRHHPALHALFLAALCRRVAPCAASPHAPACFRRVRTTTSPIAPRRRQLARRPPPPALRRHPRAGLLWRNERHGGCCGGIGRRAHHH